MKNFFALVLALMIFTACESELTGNDGATATIFDKKPEGAVKKTTLNGLWESNGYWDGTMTQKIRLQFKESMEQLILASECKYVDGTTLYVQVKSDAIFKNNGVEIEEPIQDYVTQKKADITYDCFARIPAGFITMSVNGKISIDEFTFNKIGN